MKRLPMGFKMACAMAQCVSTFLADSPFDVVVEVYVDNVMILGHDAIEVEKARLYFLNKCKLYNVTLSEDSGVMSTAIFRGMTFDFGEKTVCLKPAYVEYFRTLDLSTLSTWSDWRSYVGKVLYATQILQIPMCRIFLLLKLLASNVDTQPNCIMHVQKSVCDVARSMNLIVSKNTPRRVYEESVDTKILVTDSALSTGMWGAVLIAGAKVVLASGALSSVGNHSINVAELEAVKCAILVFEIRDRTLRVLTDNASTLFWLQSTWSPVFSANALLQKIFAKVGRIFPLYVPSRLNPADPLSRASPLERYHVDFVDFVRRTGFAVCWGGGGLTCL